MEFYKTFGRLYASVYSQYRLKRLCIFCTFACDNAVQYFHEYVKVICIVYKYKNQCVSFQNLILNIDNWTHVNRLINSAHLCLSNSQFVNNQCIISNDIGHVATITNKVLYLWQLTICLPLLQTKPIRVLTHAYLVPPQCMYLEWDWWNESLKETYL